MAALLEGKLAPRELAETTAHLRDCAGCRTIAGEMARFEREESADARQTAPRPAWWSRIAAAVAALALLVPAARWVQFRLSPMGALVAAAPREHRATEARLSRHPWARQPVASRGPAQTPEQLQVRGEAGRVLERTSGLDTAEARHAAGVAYLLIDQSRESVAELQRATARSNDARVWNDLAAALYAVGEERSGAYPDALAAADRAIQLDPRLAEAYFNRALILEKMGLPADAAWQRYLEIDPASEWSIEARARLGKRPKKDTGQHSPLRDAETELLREWADAELAGHGAAKLMTLRAAAKQLLRDHGDALLADTVEHIEQSADRRALASTLRDYDILRDARKPMPGVAAALRAAGSPMAGSAVFCDAVLAFEGNRSTEAAVLLRRLLPNAEARRYRLLAAKTRAMLANCATVGADWDTVLREASLASKGFTELGESGSAAFTTGSVALALERLGAVDEAWTHWLRAFAATQNDTHKRLVLLRSAASGLRATHRHSAADALLAIIDEDGTQSAVATVAMGTELARTAFHGGDEHSGVRWLQKARAAAERIDTSDKRALADARLAVAEGLQRSSTNPRAGVAAIGHAIAFFTKTERRIDLSDAHLQRGRAFRAAGDDDAALADLRAALEQIELQGAARNVRAVDAAEQIIEEMVELHLDRGEGRAAFAVADRAHASLVQSDVAPLPERTAVVEYMLLPRRLAIFCLTREGLVAVTVNVGRDEIARRVLSLVGDVRARRPEETIREQAAWLHRVLVAPVQSRLVPVDELVLVPDRQLQALPFAVLFDGERYLVDRYTVRYAPSAARGPAPPLHALAPAVAIGDPAAAGWPSLPFSRAEAEQVGALHGATLIVGAEATRKRVFDALKRNALVHYAGHADSDAGSHGALLLASSAEDPGIVGADEIARLSLHANAPLVVLSACGTLRGEARHVAGMPTLARAFLAAGARGVVGTQWEVEDDAATSLFVRFHQELRAGQAPARALRSAQIAMLQTSDPRFRHPAAWCAVAVLSGV